MRQLFLLSAFVIWVVSGSSAFGQQPASSSTSTISAQSEVPASEAGTSIESPEVAKAEAAILKKDWKTAEPILDSWITGHPGDARAVFDDGYVADAQGRNDDAVKLYQKASELNPKSFEAQVSLGLLLARMGKSSQAKAALEIATSLDSGAAGPEAKAGAWRAMARIDMDGGASGGKPDPAQASTDLIEALKISKESPSDTLLAAQIAEARGELPGAEAAYRRLLKADPQSSAASAGLAHLLIAQKNYGEAEPLLQTALKASPDDPALTAQLAAVLVAEDKDEALPLLEQFHSRHADNTQITIMLAQVKADAGEYAESDQLYLQLLATNSMNPELLTGHGQNLVRLHRYPEALAAFESATAADASNGEAWNGMAFAAFETHQPLVTIRALTARSKYLPETATIYFLWATAYDTLHDKKQAVAYYHRFLESAGGKFPDQEWQAKARLKLLDK